MILIDTNILMYASGVGHPGKQPSLDILEAVGEGKVDAAIDAEVLQEILYRYRSINRWEQGQVVYDYARSLFTIVLPITADVVHLARYYLGLHDGMDPRDAIHASVAIRSSLDAVVSYDRHYDILDEVNRVEPNELLARISLL